MLIKEPIVATCPYCDAKSEHRFSDWLDLLINCPACGTTLSDLAMKTKKMVDEFAALQLWSELTIAVEDRLNIAPPGIDEGAYSKDRQLLEWTLQDLASILTTQSPEKVRSTDDAMRYVQEAADKVAHQQVSASDFDRPILQVLQLPSWRRRYG